MQACASWNDSRVGLSDDPMIETIMTHQTAHLFQQNCLHKSFRHFEKVDRTRLLAATARLSLSHFCTRARASDVDVGFALDSSMRGTRAFDSR